MKNNSIFKSSSLVIVLLILGSVLCAQPNKYYVSSNGNDLNSGLIISEPFQTVQKAINIAAAGDTLFILPGIYKELIEISDKIGIPENPIVLISYYSDPEKYPVIDGGAEIAALELHNDWIHIKNSSWIEFVRIIFQNGWTNPIEINNSSYLSFRQCRFFGGKRVINVNGAAAHHILVEECFWDQGGEYLWKVVDDQKGVDAWTSMHHESMSFFNGSLIDFSGSGGSIVIRGNKIINSFNALRWRGKEGFDTNIEIYNNEIIRARDNDFEPEYYSYNLHIYHNRSHNVHRTLSIDNVNGGNIFYYGNIITTDNDDWTKKICTAFWKIYGDERNLSFPLYAFNNSFYGVGRALRAEQNMILLKHFNNAYFFTRDTSWLISKWNDGNEFNFDISNTGWPDAFTNNEQELQGKVADIKYLNSRQRDLRLATNSPGIDAGKVMFLKEFDWTQNYYGKAPNVGAFEDGELSDGPPFRFMLPAGIKTEYIEKPRIVKSFSSKNKYTVYFSAELDPASVDEKSFSLFNKNKKLKIVSVSFPRNNYEMEFILDKPCGKNEISILFNKIPYGKNGEKVTSWASAVKIYKPAK
ncbi:MAG: hypothetical protein WC061_06010 [Melioribacteraceae bacterium]